MNTDDSHRTSEERADRTPGTVVELGHIVLYVADLERSLAFYRDLLGWAVQAQPGEFPAAVFRAGNTHHDLLLIEVGRDAQPIPSGRRVGMYHFGVKVGETDDDLRAVLDRLRARPDLTKVVGASDHGMTHSLYVLDPDGNELELYIDVAGVDWDDPGLFSLRPAPLHL
jgi:catechol-2,3-dioxygenase